MILAISVPRNSAFMPETQLWHLSHVEGWRMFQKTCKIHFWSRVVRWIDLVSNHFPNFGTQNSAFMPETKVFCIFLHYEGFWNSQKQSNPSFFVQWSIMHAFCAKPFLQPRYPVIVHSLPKEVFYIFTLRRFLNRSNTIQTTIFCAME
jgi:hypothetical protein